jgi:hypothetical protein
MWTGVASGYEEGKPYMLLLGMILLGLASFAAMLAFVHLCDRVR